MSLQRTIVPGMLPSELCTWGVKFIGRYSIDDDTVRLKLNNGMRIEALYLIQTSNLSLFLELFSYAGRPFI